MDQSSGDFFQLENSLEWPSELAPGPGHPVQLEQTNYTVDPKDPKEAGRFLLEKYMADNPHEEDVWRNMDEFYRRVDRWLEETCFDQEVGSLGKSGEALRGRREI